MDPTMEQDSSGKTWYLIGALVLIGLGLWYIYGRQSSSENTPTSAAEEVQVPEVGRGDTTADIADDLSQIPDATAELNADASSASSDILNL